MDSFKVRLKRFLKSLIRLFPGGDDYLLGVEVDEYGLRYRGVYRSFDEAHSARRNVNEYDVINAGKNEKVESGDEKLDTWFSKDDYPLVYWLHCILNENSKVLELGGSLGHFFYSSKPYLPIAQQLPWQIAELPGAVKLGAKIAESRAVSTLSFIDSQELGEADAANVFMTAGTIQYIESTLPQLVASLKQKPEHVIVHQLPVHDSQSFWTLQDLQRCEVPYQIYSHEQLVATMSEQGYAMVDTWYKDRTIRIPRHSAHTVNRYAGYYFKLQEAP